jgi:hypothetical protein
MSKSVALLTLLWQTSRHLPGYLDALSCISRAAVSKRNRRLWPSSRCLPQSSVAVSLCGRKFDNVTGRSVMYWLHSGVTTGVTWSGAWNVPRDATPIQLYRCYIWQQLLDLTFWDSVPDRTTRSGARNVTRDTTRFTKCDTRHNTYTIM